jgi:hypothetical protein
MLALSKVSTLTSPSTPNGCVVSTLSTEVPSHGATSSAWYEVAGWPSTVPRSSSVRRMRAEHAW